MNKNQNIISKLLLGIFLIFFMGNIFAATASITWHVGWQNVWTGLGQSPAFRVNISECGAGGYCWCSAQINGYSANNYDSGSGYLDYSLLTQSGHTQRAIGAVPVSATCCDGDAGGSYGTGCTTVTSASGTSPGIDTTGPINTNIVITDNSGYTNDSTPTLTLYAEDAYSGMKEMAFSCNNSSWSSWIPYNTSYSSFNVTTGEGCSAGNGSKTIYAKFRDNLDQVSSVTSDSTYYDTVGPTLSSITLSNYEIKGGRTATVTFNFSDASGTLNGSTFTIAGDVTYDLSSGTLSNLSAGNGLTRTATLTANGVNDSSNTISAGTSWTDMAGNLATAGATSSIYTVTPPYALSGTYNANEGSRVLTISFDDVIDASLTDLSKIHIRGTGQSSGGVTLTGAPMPTVDGTTITITTTEAQRIAIKQLANQYGTGNLEIDLDAGAVRNTSGIAFANEADNDNTLTYTQDTTKPLVSSVTVNDEWVGKEDEGDGKFFATITFNEEMNTAVYPVVEFIPDASSTLACAGSWLSTTVHKYVCDVTDATVEIDDIDIRVTYAKDIYTNNQMLPSTQADKFNIDTIIPTLESIVLSDYNLKIGDTPTLTITFSEEVTGFTNADLTTINNGTLSPVSSGNNKVWTATFTPTTDTEDATNVITINVAGVVDYANNAGTGTTDTSNYVIDTLRPTVEITMDDYDLNIGDTALVTFTFSETVANFTNADITTINNGTLTDVETEDDIVFTATFTPTDNVEDLTNKITVTMTGINDSNGNAGTGTIDSENYEIDTKEPTVVLTANKESPTGSATIIITATFSEPVTDFSIEDIDVTNCIKGETITDINSQVKTFTIAPIANGDVTVDINADKVIDAYGNGNEAAEQFSIEYDGLAPTVENVTSTKDDGYYKAGVDINITVEFSKTVYVTGTPRLLLETGATDRYASYVDGNGTDTLTFLYTVQATDTSYDLDYVGIDSLGLNSGTIKDNALNNAVLTLAEPGEEGSLGYNKEIVIDTTAPTVSSVVLDDYAFKIGDTATLTITFSEEVDDFTTEDITYPNGSLSDFNSDANPIFTMTFTPDEDVEDSTNVITVFKTGITDLAGNVVSEDKNSSNYIVDTISPTVTNVTSAKANGYYNADTNIDITITFSEVVDVTGIPTLLLETGETDRYANYLSGTGTATLTFRYTVQTNDTSEDLDYKGIDSLSLNEGTIKDTNGNDATLTLAAPGTAGSLGANKAINVDALKPTISSLTVNEDWVGEDDAIANGFVVTVNFSEDMNTSVIPGIVFLPSVSTTLACGGVWTDIDTFTYSCDVTDTDINVADIDIRITNAVDDNTNNKMDANTTEDVFTIDTIKPTITITDNASGSWTTSDTITSNPQDAFGIKSTKWIITSNTTCNSSLDANLNAGNDGNSLAADDQAIYYNKYICFRTIDNADNKQYVASSQIAKLDTNYPIVSVGADINSNTIFTKDANSSDNTSGIETYAWTYETEVEGGEITFGTADAEDTTVSANLDGEYEITLTVTDGVDYNTSDSFTLVWDTTAPVFEEWGEGSEVYTNAEYTQTVDVNESGSGIASYLWTFENLEENEGNITFGTDNNYSTTISSDSNETYKIYFTVTDDAGNETTDWFYFTWDQEVPTIELEEDEFYTNTTFDADADVYEITETVSGIETYLWTYETEVEGGAITFDDNSTAEPEIDANKDGEYDITLTATDRAGNQVTETFTLIWDTNADFAFEEEVYYTGVTFFTNGKYNFLEDTLANVETFFWEYNTLEGEGEITFSDTSSNAPTIDANEEGIYKIYLTLTDEAGNTASADFNLVWDETRPILQQIIIPSRFEIQLLFDENVRIAGDNTTVNDLNTDMSAENNKITLTFDEPLVTYISTFDIPLHDIIDYASNGVLDTNSDNFDMENIVDLAAPYSYVGSDEIGGFYDENKLTVWLTEPLYLDGEALVDGNDLTTHYSTTDLNEDTFTATYKDDEMGYYILFETEVAEEGSTIFLTSELYDANNNQYAPMTLIFEDGSWIFKRIVDENNTSFVFDYSDSGNTYIVPSGSVSTTTEVTVDMSSVLTDQNTAVIPTGAEDLYFERQTPTTKYSATIYAGTTIEGDGWDGIFTIPTITTDFTITNGTPNVTVTVGSNAGLTFDKAVKIVIGGMAGKKAAYNDGVNTYIIAECTAGQIADPDTLQAEEECYTDNGIDMIIWTKHLTDFAAYTQNTSSGGGTIISGGSSGSSSGGYYVPVTQPTTPTPENPTQPTYEPYTPTQPVTPSTEAPETENPITPPSYVSPQARPSNTGGATGIFGNIGNTGIISVVFVIAMILGAVIYLFVKKKGFKRSRL